MERLTGKVALITGAGSGIGRAAAVRFAEEGAAVVIADIDPLAGEETADAVKRVGGDSLFVNTDVTAEQSVLDAVDATLRQFKTLDICYSNAGGSSNQDGPVTEVTLEEWTRTIQIDLYGTFLVCRSAIKVMLQTGGSVITTASIAGLVGSRQNAYSAAKGGVLALTRSMAKCYRDDGIRVNAIVPGMVETDRVLDLLRPSASEANASIRASVASRPIDIANAALFLASEESCMINGSMIVVDRGFTSVGPQGLL